MSDELGFAGGAGGMTADLMDMRATARVLDDRGTDLAGIASRARGLTVDGAMLWSLPFSPLSAARAQAHLVDAAVQLTSRAIRLEALALLLRTKAELIETADEWTATAGRAGENVGGYLVGRFAVPLSLAAAGGAALWFAAGTVGEGGDAVADVLSGEIPLSELDDRLRAAPGEQAGDMREAATMFLREHPGVTDGVIGGLPGFLNGAAGPLAPLVPDDLEGVIGALLALAGPHGLFDDRSVAITDETSLSVDLSSLAAVWDSANDLQGTVVDDPGASAVRISRVLLDGQVRWTVQVPGTQQWEPDSDDPSDATTNLELMDDGQAELMTAVVEAMRRAGIAPGEQVLLMGHSQGGIAAASLAADDAVRAEFDITTVFTGGSPVGRIDLPDGVTAVSLEHEQDPVPRLDSEANPDLPNWTTVHRDLTADLAAIDRQGQAEAARDGTRYFPNPIDAHAGNAYQRTASLLDEAAARAAAGSTDPADQQALRVLQALAPFQGAGEATDYRLEREDR